MDWMRHDEDTTFALVWAAAAVAVGGALSAEQRGARPMCG